MTSAGHPQRIHTVAPLDSLESLRETRPGVLGEATAGKGEIRDLSSDKINCFNGRLPEMAVSHSASLSWDFLEDPLAVPWPTGS